MLEGTWAVRYKDGTILSQYDRASPHFFVSPGHERGGEVPFRAIEWNRVSEVFFESDFAKSTFAILDPGEQYSLSLKCRTFMVQWSEPGPEGKELGFSAQIRAFMICTTHRDMPIDLDRVETIKAATAHVTYWLPDGSTHSCPYYDCPDVANWVTGAVKGKRVGLMPSTHELKIEIAPTLA